MAGLGGNYEYNNTSSITVAKGDSENLDPFCKSLFYYSSWLRISVHLSLSCKMKVLIICCFHRCLLQDCRYLRFCTGLIRSQQSTFPSGLLKKNRVKPAAKVSIVGGRQDRHAAQLVSATPEIATALCVTVVNQAALSAQISALQSVNTASLYHSGAGKLY